MSSTQKGGTSNKLSMKMLVNTKAQRVLYAEAGKDVVDFLLSFLTMPVGTVVKLLNAESMVGSIGNLYGSVEKLDDTYICLDSAKNALLTPAGGYQTPTGKLLQFPEAVPQVESAVFYRCQGGSYSNCRLYVTKESDTPCPQCKHKMTTQAHLVVPEADSAAAAVSPAAGPGFVQGIVTYTVMDDLRVTPMSNISGITLLNTFGITDIGSLEEKTVKLGYDEGSAILKASLQSKTALTDVFLGKTPN